MKRRDFIKHTFFVSIALAGCQSGTNNHLHSKIGKKIALEGSIIHVCPIERLKMKLKLADGEIIRVYNSDNKPFDKNKWDNKKVRINGKLEETKLSREKIRTNFEDKKLLCHIDYSPCIDSKWIENHWKNNTAEKLLAKENNKLLMKMEQTSRDYIQVFTIIADEISII